MRRIGLLMLAMVVSVTAIVGVGDVGAGAAGAQLRSALPEAEGAQDLAVNGSNSYVVYGDTPHGHAAALSHRSGHVVWRSITARKATLLAATPKVVWTATYLVGGSLVAQNAATGRILRTFPAPGEGSWETLASDGDSLYALSYSADGKHRQISTFVGDRRIGTVTAHVPMSCNSAAGAGSLYLSCFDTVNSVYRVNPRTGYVLAHSVQPGLDGGRDLAYLNGSVYFATSKQTNSQPTVVHRASARTLRAQSHSAARNIIGIAAAGHHVLALQSARSSGSVLDLDPASLKLRSSIVIHSRGYPFFLATGMYYAYVVQVTAYSGPGTPDETLVRVPLPKR